MKSRHPVNSIVTIYLEPWRPVRQHDFRDGGRQSGRIVPTEAEQSCAFPRERAPNRRKGPPTVAVAKKLRRLSTVRFTLTRCTRRRFHANAPRLGLIGRF